MTRGRRDGILKSEKTRHVVKIGPMHLKGVWLVFPFTHLDIKTKPGFIRIPFDRALEFANREKITDLLYPLFVHNIGALLYHPTNSTRTNAVMEAAANRRRPDKGAQGGMLGNAATQPSGLHHHHSISGQMPSQVGQSSLHSLNQQSGVGRPTHPERAHTFPTPPTSASSVIGNQGSSYDWSNQSTNGSVQTSQPLAIDTGLSNARSLPNTPASTPPGNSMPNMQSYQGQQSYEKPVYSTAPQPQSQYATQQQNMARFGQPPANPYVKSDMGPPSRTTGSSSEADHPDIKQDPYAQQSIDQVAHNAGDEEGDHEHESDYSHDSSAYNANRGGYSYNSGVMGILHGEASHLSPEQVNGSPHQNGSGRVTPRNTSVSQSQWSAGYNTPPRGSQSGNLYNAVSDSRSSVTNGHAIGDSYSSQSYSSNAVNGANISHKRAREDDELDYKPRGGSGADIESLKRRKSGRENSIGAISAYDQSQLSRPGNTIIPRLGR